MKKLMTILTATVLLFSATAFATGGEKVTAKVKIAFEKDFQKAQNVTWERTGDFYFASFVMNDVSVNAAYDETGELVGTLRKINTIQLPLSISVELAKKYSDYTIRPDASELNYNGETSYLVTVGNAKQTLRLKFRTNGEVSVDKKVKN